MFRALNQGKFKQVSSHSHTATFVAKIIVNSLLKLHSCSHVNNFILQLSSCFSLKCWVNNKENVKTKRVAEKMQLPTNYHSSFPSLPQTQELLQHKLLVWTPTKHVEVTIPCFGSVEILRYLWSESDTLAVVCFLLFLFENNKTKA